LIFWRRKLSDFFFPPLFGTSEVGWGESIFVSFFPFSFSQFYDVAEVAIIHKMI
jgi:hypothetical protein